MWFVGTKRRIMIWVGITVFLGALFISAGIFLYNLYVRHSLQKETRVRFANERIKGLLQPIYRQGEAGAPGILFLHGFGGSPNDFRPLINALPLEYTIRAPSLPGHGINSPTELEKLSPNAWQEFLQSEVEFMLANHEVVIVCGFSFGGLLALDQSLLNSVAASIIINPYMGTPHRAWYILPPSAWINLKAPFIPYVKKLKSGQINCEEGSQAYEPGYWHLSTRSFQVLNRYSRYIQNNIPSGTSKVYAHISRHDIVSDPIRMQKFVAEIGVDATNISVWNNSNHVLLYDYDANEAIAKIIAQITYVTNSTTER